MGVPGLLVIHENDRNKLRSAMASKLGAVSIDVFEAEGTYEATINPAAVAGIVPIDGRR